MTVRVTLLTTDTAHHRYFAAALAERGLLERIVEETTSLTPPFDTFHPFEALRDEHERAVLPGATTPLHEIAETQRVARADDAAETLARLRPQAIVVFGTSRIGPALIGAADAACLNLHGGNPEEYRGLDTHLWAIYHRDFANIVTTLHHVDAGLDTGDVVGLAPLPLRRDMRLHELREANARVCVDLTLRALADLDEGRGERRPQTRRGRYYSFMPAVLKERCVEIFERHAASL